MKNREPQAGTDRGPLHGIPIGIKDIIATDEGPTQAQSLAQDPAWGDQGDGPLIKRLREAGAVFTGKTTTMEYAIGFPDFDKPFPQFPAILGTQNAGPAAPAQAQQTESHLDNS